MRSRYRSLAVALMTCASAARLALGCEFDLREVSTLVLPPPLPETKLAVGDLDRDGAADVVVTYPGCPGEVHVVRTVAGGLVAHQVLAGLSFSPAGAEVADLDLDGDVDIAVGHLEGTLCGTRGVTVIHQRPDGTFGDASTFPGDGDGRVLRIGDLDGSGTPVIVTGDGPVGLNPTTGKIVQVRENEGPGDFSHVHEFGETTSPGGLPLAIGIGFLDVRPSRDVLVSWSNRLVSGLCNFGDGTFETWTLPIAVTNLGLGGVAIGDVNADGLMDVAFSHPSSTTLDISIGGSAGLNCAPPAFATPCSTSDGIQDLLIVDLDVDGNADIVGAVPTRDALAFHGGTGQGSFSPVRERSLGGSPRRIATGDFDGNPRPDLVVLETDGTLALLINESPTNRCPVARTSTSIDVPVAADACIASVPLDGSRSFDLDGDSLLYRWSTGGTVVLETSMPIASFDLPPGAHQWVLVVVDPSGHESRPASLNIFVRDTTPPSLSAVAITDVECADSTGADVVLTASATDNCGPPTLSSSLGPGDTVSRRFPVGETRFSWRARDANANLTVRDVVVRVRDTQPPTCTCLPEVVVDCDGPGLTIVPVFATASDACTPPSAMVGSNDRTCGGFDATDAYPVGETLVTFQAEDGARLTTTCTTRVLVRDATPPRLFPPSLPMRIECTGAAGAVASLFATAADDCSTPVVTNDRRGGQDASGVYPLGSTAVSWTATDGSGLVDSATTLVEVVDTTAPSLEAPASIEIPCTSASGERVAVRAFVFDACDPSPSVANDRTAGGADASDDYPLGTTRVSFTATDAAGNSASRSTQVSVTDVLPPGLDCPASLRVECSGAVTPVALLAHASDCCDPSPSVSNDRTAGGANASGPYLLGTTSVRFTAADAAGHAATCDTTVVVEDTTPPVVLCPAEVVAECAGPGGTPVSLQAFAADRCDASPAVSNDRTAGGADASGTYPLGRTLVRFTALDDAGLVATCDSTVVVRDTLPPLVQAVTDTPCLWPPNHRFVRFGLGEHLRVLASDLCAGPGDLTLSILDVTSNEAADGRGDGSTEPDVVVRGDEMFLRSERQGGAPGRVYSVRLLVTDPSGNGAEASVEVRVPHGGSPPEGCKTLPHDRFVDDRLVIP